MHKCNFIHTYKKSLVFTTPKVGELKSAYQKNVQICYTEIQLSRKINVESAGSNSYTPLSKVHGLDFSKVTTAEKKFMVISTDVFPNRIKSVYNGSKV